MKLGRRLKHLKMGTVSYLNGVFITKPIDVLKYQKISCIFQVFFKIKNKMNL